MTGELRYFRLAETEQAGITFAASAMTEMECRNRSFLLPFFKKGVLSCLPFLPIVRRLARDRDVMHMAFS